MQFAKAPIFLACITAALAAPAHQKRGDTCTILGTTGMSQSTCGQAVNCIAVSRTLELKCSNGVSWDNGGDMPIAQTIKASDTGLEGDIVWDQKWETGGYDWCNAAYNGGDKIDGKVDDPEVSSSFGVSDQSYTCSVTFDI
ncbi:hypothetical protein N7532_006701 [Penicillium argentinense]|uniref:Uncharacterized protein n=1 Tax=Penicillium argentinense TaxID=1131581 RepID=A0A9W9FGK7_9EURO|nr:uncharacterized protein N7532_006701 [Penicillium argentinense]KAJ5099700.1 hypothetical protein N7532_006701 [Penicillium argentinense]